MQIKQNEVRLFSFACFACLLFLFEDCREERKSRTSVSSAEEEEEKQVGKIDFATSQGLEKTSIPILHSQCPFTLPFQMTNDKGCSEREERSEQAG